MQTLRVVDKLSAGFDVLLRDWKERVELAATPHHSLSTPHSRVMVPINVSVHGLDVDSPSVNSHQQEERSLSSSSSSLTSIDRSTPTEGENSSYA